MVKYTRLANGLRIVMDRVQEWRLNDRLPCFLAFDVAISLLGAVKIILITPLAALLLRSVRPIQDQGDGLITPLASGFGWMWNASATLAPRGWSP